MKAIVDMTPEEHAMFHKSYIELRGKIADLKLSEMFSDFKRTFGYAHYKFDGYISDKLIDALGRVPTANEIIMIVDSGYSHFGASCTISGRRFSGRVNID